MERVNRAPRAPGQAVIEHVAAALPGWLLLIGGLALLAMAVLTPAWLEHERLAWERDVLAAQTEHLSEQAERYAELHTALAEEDPVLLERLAFVELGLKPVDKTPLLPEQHGQRHRFAADRSSRTRPGGIALMAVDAGTGRESQTHEPAMEREAVRPVNEWPIRPLPRIGRELPAYEEPNTRLTRLTTGDSRFGLIAAGLLCLLAACYPGMWQPRGGR